LLDDAGFASIKSRGVIFLTLCWAVFDALLLRTNTGVERSKASKIITINTLDVIAVNYITSLKSGFNKPAKAAKMASLGLVSLLFSSNSFAELPIYAAYVSDQIESRCAQTTCQLNPLDGEQLTAIGKQLKSAVELAEALSTSEYEVLIGNALVDVHIDNTSNVKTAELVLEITTSWRQVPIDDIELNAKIDINELEASTSVMLQKWVEHLEENKVLEADRIYETLNASNYNKELAVPDAIGDFVLQASAVYRDPLMGSITRYVHPDFTDAVVDISVYPFSPFKQVATDVTDLASNTAQSKFSDVSNANRDYLALEMKDEVSQIKQLIAQANIQDYSISDVQAAEVVVAGKAIQGFRLEVLLNTESDPVYSTQYVFKQNDKVIKLTGNLPQFMMSALVSESLPQIRVPAESSFMRSLRQG
jgi:hypothetical protein